MDFEKSAQTAAKFCRGKERTQKLKQAEKESVEWKRLLRLLKKKALKAVKKEADKDGRDKAEEEEEQVDISQVSLLSSSTVTVKKREKEQRHD